VSINGWVFASTHTFAGVLTNQANLCGGSTQCSPLFCRTHGSVGESGDSGNCQARVFNKASKSTSVVASSIRNIPAWLDNLTIPPFDRDKGASLKLIHLLRTSPDSAFSTKTSHPTALFLGLEDDEARIEKAGTFNQAHTAAMIFTINLGAKFDCQVLVVLIKNLRYAEKIQLEIFQPL
jgi:hypothetical protein